MTRKEAEKAVRKVICRHLAAGLIIPENAFKDSVEAVLAASRLTDKDRAFIENSMSDIEWSGCNRPADKQASGPKLPGIKVVH